MERKTLTLEQAMDMTCLQAALVHLDIADVAIREMRKALDGLDEDDMMDKAEEVLDILVMMDMRLMGHFKDLARSAQKEESE